MDSPRIYHLSVPHPLGHLSMFPSAARNSVSRDFTPAGSQAKVSPPQLRRRWYNLNFQATFRNLTHIPYLQS